MTEKLAERLAGAIHDHVMRLIELPPVSGDDSEYRRNFFMDYLSNLALIDQREQMEADKCPAK